MWLNVKRILNHNVILAVNSLGQECVVTGKGIASQKKVNDHIEPQTIEKIFKTQGKGVAEKLSKIVGSIPLQHVRVCDEIINMARRELHGNLNDKIYLTLIDHLSFAIDRHNDGIDLKSSLKWEMQQFYPEEFQVGMMALQIIQTRLDVNLPDDEAAFVAFHLVNAGSPGGENIQDSLEMIHDVLEIVKAQFELIYDERSLSYNRFITHLKYFSRRMFNMGGAPEMNTTDNNLLRRFRDELPSESNCVEEISEYISKHYHHTVDDNEKAYLIMHIHSLRTR